MPTALRTGTVVASVPSDHVYVRHLAPETDDGVARLPDPEPGGADRSTEQAWWPPAMLDPAWIGRHEFDVFHVNFGFDAWSPEQLVQSVAALRATGRRFVFTVHDLRNPHHRTRALHDAQLDVLVPAADELVTLTDGAAEEIERRWGRRAYVLPHPHVVDFERMARAARRSSRTRVPFRVGLHLKSVRASMDPVAVLPTLISTVAELPGAVLQVNGHRELLERGGKHHDAGLAAYLRRAERDGELELHVHDFMSDDELWDYFEGLDVSVLPYRFGTHSGWLEACRDLGTAVVAPSCGYYRDQGPVHEYLLDEEEYDARTLRRALHDAYDAGPVPPLPVEHRRAQRAALADAHRQIYQGRS